MWTFESIKNQKRDRTPYSDEQIHYLVRVLNSITFPWKSLDIGNVKISHRDGPFSEVYTLEIDNQCYMTNTPQDLLDHRRILEEASGNVLLTGYGLGVGVLLCNLNPNVKSITVLENNPLIIEHVVPMVDKACPLVKAQVIETDANIWEPPCQYDFGYIDHAYARADETRYIPYCKTIVNWYDERMLLESTCR